MAMRVNGNIIGRVSNAKVNIKCSLTTGHIGTVIYGYTEEQVKEIVDTAVDDALLDVDARLDEINGEVVPNKTEHLLDTKGLIRNAINGHGVELDDTDTFRSYADKIRNIGKEEVEITEWVKPEGWPDIKEGMKENQIRMLICDTVNRGQITLSSLGQGTNPDFTIDWGGWFRT